MLGGESVLEFENVEIAQGDFRLSVHLEVEDGARVAVLGPSGAGKSTLLLAISGFIPLKQGIIRLGNKVLSTLEPGDRPVSMLFQDNNLFGHMTIAQNVGLALRPSLRLSTDEWARVSASLNEVGLAGMEYRKPAELSGGQQSRAALARVMLQNRPILLLDEPFAALGPALKAEMLELVQSLCERKGMTLLMVSHDPDDALRICEAAILVAGGIAHAVRETGELLGNPPPELRDYLGQ